MITHKTIVSTVSIHAPVMDANTYSVIWDNTMTVSIHAPVMDANCLLLVSSASVSFNPRARDGREIKRRKNLMSKIVSIHAPVMDAKNLH